MNARLLMVSSDLTLVAAVKEALSRFASFLRVDRLDLGGEALQAQFQPTAVIVDTDASIGVHTAFDRIFQARLFYPDLPIIAVGNEMSAQLVLAALRAGANEFIDRDSGRDQLRQAIEACLAQKASPVSDGDARVIGVLTGLPNDLDQDFCLNLALRAAKAEPDKKTLYVDLSIPASQADLALGIEIKFSVLDCIREIARLDGAFLDGAVAHDPRTGLYILPFIRRVESEGASLDIQSFAALLQLLKSVYHNIIIGYGPFSHHRDLIKLLPASSYLVCCNQRFASIRSAKELLTWLNELGAKCRIVFHEISSNAFATPQDVFKTLGLTDGVVVPSDWNELIAGHNDGKPPALSDSSRYTKSLDGCLSGIGFSISAPPGGLSLVKILAGRLIKRGAS